MASAAQSVGLHDPLISARVQSAQENKMASRYGATSHSGDSSGPEDDFPFPSWTLARSDHRKRRFPQTISHRGYKAMYPENTMSAFQGAIQAGTHAIETDIHLTNDDVVVLSHDQDLKRCFDREEKVVDCNWEFISQLRTTRAPHVPMPRLYDLLEYLSQPEQQNIWLFLDIKVDNNADKVMRLISQTLQSVNPGSRHWIDRVVLGIWAAKFLPLCVQYLPGYSVSNIAFTARYAKQFLAVPNLSINMRQNGLLGPIEARFMREVKKAGRPLFLWTVNDVNMMKWAVQKEVDGVITDDPRLFNEICDNWNENEPIAKPTWSQWFYTFWLACIIIVFSIPFKRKFPETVEQYFLKGRGLQVKGSARREG